MKIQDNDYLRIQCLYNKADVLVGLNHRTAVEKFQIFGKDAIEHIEMLHRYKYIMTHKSIFFELLSEALLHYSDCTTGYPQAESVQITAFFRTKQGKLWFANLQYCIRFFTKARNKQAANAARELFSLHTQSELCEKLEKMTQVKAFVSYIHFMAKDIQDTNVVKVNFKTGKYKSIEG